MTEEIKEILHKMAVDAYVDSILGIQHLKHEDLIKLFDDIDKINSSQERPDA
jgi:hypothetical protein